MDTTTVGSEGVLRNMMAASANKGMMPHSTARKVSLLGRAFTISPLLNRSLYGESLPHSRVSAKRCAARCY